MGESVKQLHKANKREIREPKFLTSEFCTPKEVNQDLPELICDLSVPDATGGEPLEGGSAYKTGPLDMVLDECLGSVPSRLAYSDKPERLV